MTPEAMKAMIRLEMENMEFLLLRGKFQPNYAKRLARALEWIQANLAAHAPPPDEEGDADDGADPGDKPDLKVVPDDSDENEDAEVTEKREGGE